MFVQGQTKKSIGGRTIWIVIVGSILSLSVAHADTVGTQPHHADDKVSRYREWLDALERRAEANERYGYRDNAIADYRAVLKHDPNFKAARDGLVRLGVSPQ